MNVYKMLVADIDGTTVDHGSVGEEVKAEHPSLQSVRNAQLGGKIVTFATGRNYPKAESVIKAFDIKSPVIVNNGSQIVEPETGYPLWERRIDNKKARNIYDFIMRSGLADDSMIGFGYLSELKFDEVGEETLEDIIYLDIIGIKNTEYLHTIQEYISEIDGVTHAMAHSPQMPGRTNILVTDEGATKYFGLIELQKMLGITKEETIAIGDGDNDIPLFEASGLRVAVDNASDKLKANADMIVSSVHEHGLAQAIDNHLLASNNV